MRKLLAIILFAHEDKDCKVSCRLEQSCLMLLLDIEPSLESPLVLSPDLFLLLWCEVVLCRMKILKTFQRIRSCWEGKAYDEQKYRQQRMYYIFWSIPGC